MSYLPNLTAPPPLTMTGQHESEFGEDEDGLMRDKIDYYAHVVVNLVERIKKYGTVYEGGVPLALQAEYFLQDVSRKCVDLTSIIKITEDRSKCKSPSIGNRALGEVVKVEQLRQQARRWKWGLEDKRKRKTLSLLDKEKMELQQSHDLMKIRRLQLQVAKRSINAEIQLQSQVKVKWQSTACNASRHLNALESSFEFVAQPHTIPFSTSSFQSTVRGDTDAKTFNSTATIQTLGDVRNMKIAVTKAQRANREIEMMLAFEKQSRKKLMDQMQQCIDRIIHQCTRHDKAEIPPRVWCGPKANDLLLYRPTSRLLAHPGAVLGVEFLKHATSSSGMFPFNFLGTVANDNQSACLDYLCNEFVNYAFRKLVLERAFQSLHEIRFLNKVDKAVEYIVGILCCTLSCDRASFWIVDNERGIAWTKFAAGGREMCIPLDSGLVGSAAETKTIVHVKDAYLDPRFNRSQDEKTGYRTKSVICAPILRSKFRSESEDDNKVFAVVQVINKSTEGGAIGEGVFDDTDIFLLTTLGYGMTEVVLGCEKEELDLQTNYRKNTLLSFTWEIYLHCYRMEDLVRIVIKYLEKLFRSVDASLTLAHPDYVERYTINAKNKLVITKHPKEVGLVGACIDAREKIHVRQVESDTRYDSSIDLSPEGMRADELSLHCLPLRRGGLMSAVIQWVCAQRSRVDFGDDGLFNEANPRHFDLLAKVIQNIHLTIEKWYPAMDRMHAKSAKSGGRL